MYQTWFMCEVRHYHFSLVYNLPERMAASIPGFRDPHLVSILLTDLQGLYSSKWVSTGLALFIGFERYRCAENGELC